MIVTGKAVSAERALQIGLVDELCDCDLDAHAPVRARHAAHAETASRVLKARTLAIEQHDNEAIAQWLAKLPPEDKGCHASRACVQAVKAATELPFDEGLAFERATFLRCRDTTESKALRHVFFAEREASKIPKLADSLALRTVASVGIVGAGTMGIGIAMSFASAGISVVLQDRKSVVSGTSVSVRVDLGGRRI